MNVLLRYLRNVWPPAAGASAFAAVNQVFGMMDPFIFRRIIDGYVMPGRHHAPRESLLGAGLWLAALVAATTLSWAAKTLQLTRAGQVSQRVAAAMYADGVRQVLEMPYDEFEHARSGETLDRLQKLRTKVEQFVAGAINVFFVSLVGVAFVVAYATSVDWLIGGFLFFTAAIMIWLSSSLSQTLRRSHREVFREGAALAGAATETLRNMELVKSLGLAQQQISRLHESSGRMLEFELEGIRRVRRFTFVHGGCVQTMRLSLVALLFWFLYLGRVSVGQFFALFLYSRFLFMPLQQIGTVIQDFRAAESALDAFRKLLGQPGEGRPAHPVPLGELCTIEFENVRFQYTGGSRPALDGVSFKVSRGETIAFVGPSGAGKTTIVKLLSGLYAPHSGRILYNGFAQHQISLDDSRARLGLVAQDAQLFSGSVRDNLRLVRPDAGDAECLAAIEQAAAQSILERGGRGLDTVIGEGGLRLSGGERQRLAIARALLRQPSLIVFDEATSALDSLTEREISQTLDMLAGRSDAITILIAHRLSTVAHAGVIHVLDQGKIVQSGTHEELSAASGLYREMWLQQVNRLLSEPAGA